MITTIIATAAGGIISLSSLFIKDWLDERAKIKQKRLEKLEETYLLLFQMFNWANVATLNIGNLPLNSIVGEKVSLPMPDLPLAKIILNIRIYFPDLIDGLENIKTAISEFSSAHSNALLRAKEMLANNNVDFAELTKELREKSICIHTAQIKLQSKLETLI